MDPSPPAVADPNALFARRFRARAGAAGRLSFADFMEVALYDPQCGYYAAPRARVGRGAGTDFYTASSLDAVFGPLVVAAARRVAGGAARECTFVEIGAEPGRSVAAGVAHGFGGTCVVRRAESAEMPARAVVFSNELFDAQPFHRVVWRRGRWREVGVHLEGEAPVWCELREMSPELVAAHDRLPRESSEGYTIDLPWRAARLLAEIVARPWHGWFLAFDYGRTWRALCHDYPHGTGRAYRAHRQCGDLLATPGRQDLTCHVCWDWLEDTLRAAAFSQVQRESQEAFFLHHATDAIDQLVRADANPLSRTRTQLKHLLHPGLMGQRFEVLRAVRA